MAKSKTTRKKKASKRTSAPETPALSPADQAKQREMLATVRSNFDDDAPRLVYADWLLERGDPRGEFIQVQCSIGERIHGATGRAREPDPTPANYAALRATELAIYRKHRKAWLAPIEPFIRKFSFRRGFVDTIDSGPGFAPGAAAVFEQHPLEILTMQGMKKDADYLALAEVPLPGLRRLGFDQQTISTRAVEGLFGSTTMSDLPGLSLYASTIERDGLEFVFEHSRLTGLRYLDIGLQAVSCDDEVLLALGRSSVLRNLEQLNLGYLEDYFRGGPLTTQGVIRFVERCELPKLERIVVCGGSHYFPDDVLAALHGRFEVVF